MVLALVLAVAAADVRYVEASVAQLQRQDAPAKRVAVPIGAEVRVLRASGATVLVETLDGVRGSVAASSLSREPPVLAELLEKYEATKERRYLDRAAALAPSDVDVIARFADAQRNREQLYLARKGWVAVKRRSLMWDGPLYPIDARRVRLPAACASHDDGGDGPTGMESAELDAATASERRRAFRWVSSGKVVSVSERADVTEHLRKPSCDGDKLAYAIDSQRGALVPSWLVAGFTVTPVRGESAVNARHRVELSTEGRKLAVTVSTFTTKREATLELSRSGAEPVAVFSDSPGALLILMHGPECAPRESTVSLVRARLEGDALRLEEGRPWGCGQTPFTQLEGEPRDVSHEALLGDGWKR